MMCQVVYSVVRLVVNSVMDHMDDYVNWNASSLDVLYAVSGFVYMMFHMTIYMMCHLTLCVLVYFRN